MGKVTFRAWDKKPRTMLRFLKPGDIFAFCRGENLYGFGRLITKVDMGHMAEIFSYVSEEPVIPEAEFVMGELAWGPACLDTYSLFDRKLKGDWRIIGHEADYRPSGYENVYFVYGSKGDQKRIDIFDMENVHVTDEEAEKWPYYTNYGDTNVQDQLDELGFPRSAR